jgi:hypothetical protein
MNKRCFAGAVLSSLLWTFCLYNSLTPNDLQAACAPAPSGLVSWWRADGGGADAGGSNPGTLLNGATFVPGIAGQAFGFSNVNQIVRVPDAPSLNPTSTLTLEGWIQVTANPSTDASVIVGKDDLVSGRQYELDIYLSGGQRVFLVNLGLPAGFVSLLGTKPVPLNTWTHVAVTYDGSSVRLYVNGDLDTSLTASGSVTTGTAPLTIGGLGTGPWSFFGAVDELSLYNRALSVAEVQSIYSAGAAGKCVPVSFCAPTPPGLVGWWSGEGNGSDSKGTNNGTLVNGAGYSQGEVGRGFSFNGVNQFLKVPDAPELNPTAALTLEAWVYVEAYPSIDIVAIMSKEDPNGVHQYQMTLWNTQGKWCFRPTIVVNGNAVYFPGTTAVQTGRWYHLATTYDGTSIKQFVNGIFDGSAPASGSVATSTQPVRIGGDEIGWFFNGRVDEASLYNRALSELEILSIYNAGAGGKCSGPVAPVIFSQPTNQTVLIGQSADFIVLAAGTQPLSYQWSFEGAAIPGATNATLSLTNVQSLQAGAYSVGVTNIVGGVTSSNAQLSVNVPPPCMPSPQGLVGWWPGQNNGMDVRGINNGTLLNGASFAAGKVGQSFAFNGVNQFVRIPDAPELDPTNAITIEAWVYVSGFPGLDIVTIIGKENPNGVHQYQLTLWNTLGRWCFRPTIVTGNDVAYFPGNTAVEVGKWYHVAVTYDGNKVEQYVNGVFDGSIAATGSIVTSGEPLRIGGDEIGWFFNGLVDEASIYSRAITATEIRAIYAADFGGKCSGPSAPVVYAQPLNQTVFVGQSASFSVAAAGTEPLSYQWSFGNTLLPGATSSVLTLTNIQMSQAGFYSVQITNGLGAIDSSNAVLAVNAPPPCFVAPSGLVSWWPAEGDANDVAYGNSGVALNGAGYAAGLVGQAFRFTAANQVVQILNEPSLNPTNSLTLEAWVNINGYPSTDASIIVGKDDLAGGRQYELDVLRKGNSVVFTANVGVPGGFVGLTGSNSIPLNTWTHVAMTYDGSSLRIYVNGALDSSLAVTGPITTGTAPLRVGGLGSGPWTFFGLVDEFALFQRALSTLEIQSIVNAGVAGKCSLSVPPVISTQPSNQTVVIGQSAVFNVFAGGTHPLSYQWTHNGTGIDGATSSSLVLTNVQRGQAGTYAVSITNAIGNITSDNALLTVSFPPANVRVVGAAVGPDGTVAVPIALIANGNEHAIGFSFNFSPSLLAYSGVALGNAASGATLVLNTNLVGLGRLGVALSLPTSSTFPAGTQEVIVVSLTAATLNTTTSTPISFGDQPTARELSDPEAVALAANFFATTILIPAADIEGDVTPRPNGDRATTITDWVQLGRYAARLDYPTNAGEYQRADCAPRSTGGDGAITVADWVQAGRYAAALDPATRAGGPTNDVGPLVGTASGVPKDSRSGLDPRAKGLTPRQLRVAASYLVPGEPGVIPVVLEAQGNENALGFSLAFDPAVFAYTNVSLGANGAGATIQVNALGASQGKLAVVLTLPVGQAFPAGSREVIRVMLTPLSSAVGVYPLALTDQPVVRQVVDPTALPLSTDYLNGNVVVNPLPTLNIAPATRNITLSWPLWATNFTLQEADGAALPSLNWTNVPAQLGISNNSAVTTLPVTNATKLYRLAR